MLHPTFLSRPITHRGLHDRAKGVVENSRDAFQAAIDAGFGIECDLQLSSDGAAIVFHDYDLGRLTGETGPVRRRSRAELGQIALTDSANRIEDLDALLNLVAGQVPLLIELKDQDGAMGPDIGPLEEATAAALKTYDGPVAVMSFNPHSTIRMGQLLPDLPRGLTTSDYQSPSWPLGEATRAHLREIPDFERSGSSFISHEARDLARPRVAELRAKGAAILCWTIRSEAEANEALKYADNITFEGFLPA